MGRPVKARASRRAAMLASVPELVRRTFSTDGNAWWISSANSTSLSVEAPKLVPVSRTPRRAAITSGWQ